MLRSVTVPDRKSVHSNHINYTGVLVTPDDLSNSRMSADAKRSSSVYVKPLKIEIDRLDSESHLVKEANAEPAHELLPKKRTSSGGPRGDVSKTIHSDLRRRIAGSPAANRIHRSSFNRHSAVRRSLGGAAIPPVWLGDDTSNVDSGHVKSIATHPKTEAAEPPTISTNLQFRVSRLPSWDELGFELVPYFHLKSDNFVGFRLQDRFRTRNIQLVARELCPFHVNDIILTVSQYKLSKMNEAQALRYVYNALRDARQYTIEFGVHRQAGDAHKPKSERIHRYKSSTLDGRASGTNRFSALCVPDSSSENDALSLNPHRPLRGNNNSSTSSTSPFYPIVVKATLGASNDPSPNNSTSLPSRSNSITDPQSKTQVNPAFNRSVSTGTFPRGDLLTPPTASVEPRRSFGATAAAASLNAFNTRTIGQKISIDLVKSDNGGLGFALTRRDTQTSAQSNEPVYIKTILSSGAAIRDGRLMVGDRLLIVDNQEVENLEQVLAQLRRIPPGTSVNLVVSRQATAGSDSGSHRKSTRTNPCSPTEQTLPPHRSLTFEFSVPSTGANPPGLGVNFQWSLKPLNPDLAEFSCPGLYVDSLLPIGLISDAGRETLIPGDRLVGVNGQSLEGLSAKAITSRIKSVLMEASSVTSPTTPSGSHHRNFSLTVHRYSKHNDQSPVTDLPTPSDRSVHTIGPSHRRAPVRRASWDKRMSSAASFSDTVDLFKDDVPSRNSSVPPNVIAISTFDREGFGRRSVSEKRHGHIDPNQYSFYKTNILPNRYKMPEDVDKQYSTMPTARRLKLHKERLTATSSGGPLRVFDVKVDNQSTTKDKDGTRSAREENPEHQGHFRRGKKQNNSFRSAVDRSLTVPTSSVTSSVNPTGIVPSDHQTTAKPEDHTSLTTALESPTPPVPPRQASSTKKRFGSFKGLFRRAEKKTVPSDQNEPNPLPLFENNRAPVSGSHDFHTLRVNAKAQSTISPSRNTSNSAQPRHVDVGAHSYKASRLSHEHSLPASSDKRSRWRTQTGDQLAPPPVPPRIHHTEHSGGLVKQTLPESLPVESPALHRPYHMTVISSPPQKPRSCLPHTPDSHRKTKRTSSPVYIPKPCPKLPNTSRSHHRDLTDQNGVCVTPKTSVKSQTNQRSLSRPKSEQDFNQNHPSSGNTKRKSLESQSLYSPHSSRQPVLSSVKRMPHSRPSISSARQYRSVGSVTDSKSTTPLTTHSQTRIIRSGESVPTTKSKSSSTKLIYDPSKLPSPRLPSSHNHSTKIKSVRTRP